MKKYNKLVSIIVPVFNCEAYLDKCLNSILNQSYTNLEIILVDDGSTDNSGIICDKFSELDSRVRVIHKDNQGVAIARNTGIKCSNGIYIGFVDSDDFLESTMYEKMINQMDNNNADLVMCNYYILKDGIVDYHNHNIENNILEIENLDEFFYLMNKDYYRGFCWNKLFKKSLLNNLSFDSNIAMCEDLLFVSQYATLCKKMVFLNECLYNYYQREGSAVNSKINYKHLTAIKAYEKIIFLLKNNYVKCVDDYYKTLFFWNNDIQHKFVTDDKKILSEIKMKNRQLFIYLIKSNNISLLDKINIFIRFKFHFLLDFIRFLKKI